MIFYERMQTSWLYSSMLKEKKTRFSLRLWAFHSTGEEIIQQKFEFTYLNRQ